MADLDVRALEAQLRTTVDGDVCFDGGSRALYATDASNYRQVPIGVVVPRSLDDVEGTVAACRDHGAPLVSRGGATSLAGQCCNAAVVIDWSKHLRHVITLDPDRKVARVEPGCVLDTLRAAARPHGLTFAPDPATHTHCTLGGMIGNNSCGVHSLLAGQERNRTSDFVESLDVLTYDGLRLRLGPAPDDEVVRLAAEAGRRGQIYAGLGALRDRYAELIRTRFPDIPRRVSGYPLDELLPERGPNLARSVVGTEGTCVTVLEAELRLVPEPPARALLVLGYPDIATAADQVPAVLEAQPTGLEAVDHLLYEYNKMRRMHLGALESLPSGWAWLFVEFGGESRREADSKAMGLVRRLEKDRPAPSFAVFEDPDVQESVWGVREAGLAATSRTPGGRDNWPGWEDSAVAPDRLGAYLRDLKRLYRRYDYDGSVYGHFGQGCVHSRIDFDLFSVSGVAKFRSFMEDAADLVVAHAGSLSGEHGDGQARGELLAKMYGAELVEGFREFKGIWDPENRMNPGKVVEPNRLDEHLRLGPGFRPREPETTFQYPHDQGSFNRAAMRCVGVGKCRRDSGGTMCPSYMVTREEQHSTRGRARLLFEMIQGEVISDGWRSKAVHEALDLCLACKGCKGECPVQVDMATYKAEFLSHHYAGRLRPASHYSMGLLPAWARLGKRAPRVVNATTHMPGLSRLAKRVAGVDERRELPRFARTTFRRWFSERPAPPPKGRPVVLWPDTFTDHFHPQIGQAAVDVLEAAGFDVTIPAARLCCGLPLISTGMLKTARRWLRRDVAALAEDVAAGVPVVGLEPSCTAVFRSDLEELLPHDLDAKRLAQQTFTLAELLDREGWQPPRLPGRRIVVHGHCHHKAIMGFDADRHILDSLAVDAEVLDSGCCGLAGNFGFERGHWDVSVACAARVLLPAVRKAAADTLVLTDGFSCRTQIEQLEGRGSLHIAEVLALALREGQPQPQGTPLVEPPDGGRR